MECQPSYLAVAAVSGCIVVASGVTLKHDGMHNCFEDVHIAMGAVCTVIDNRAIMAQTGQLISTLAASVTLVKQRITLKCKYLLILIS